MKHITLVLLALLPFLAMAQTAERSVVASAGRFASGGGFSHSYTIGQAVVFSSVSSNFTVTQGFQQSSQTGLSIAEQELAYAVTAFPNPTRDDVTLDIQTGRPVNLRIAVFTLQGQQCPLPQEWIHVNGALQHRLDFSNLAPGNYFIRITDEDGKRNDSIQLLKVAE